VSALTLEQEDHIKSASAWSLGQIGRHTPDHAKALADSGVLPKLVAIQAAEASSEDLKTKCKRGLKAIVEKLTDMAALDALVQEAELPESIVRAVLAQISKVLPNDTTTARSEFVTSGGFAKVQQLDAAAGSKLKEFVDVINSCYPEEIVKYYSPGYSQQLLEKLDQMNAGA